MKAEHMVTFELDPLHLPPLTEEQETRLRALADLPDESIDFSDIPALGSEAWRDAKRGLFYRPVKHQTTLRLDADVIDWFKRQTKSGKGYQTDINRVLREYVATESRKTTKKAV